MSNYLGVATDTPALAQLKMNGAGSTTLTAMYKASIIISPASVAANTTAEQIFPCANVKVGDYVDVNKPTAQAGLGICGVRVTSAGNIGITFQNNTAAPIGPSPGETYIVFGCR
jgi:hypothetical protein